MSAIILVIHVLLAIILVGIVLLQRSEGGALGIGGGGMMSGRAAGNMLTKTTAVLAVCFFATSMGLALLDRGGESILEDIPGGNIDQGVSTPAPAPTPIPQPEEDDS